MEATERFGIQGRVSPGFEAVHQAFAENFIQRRELGGACCAFYHGEKVVYTASHQSPLQYLPGADRFRVAS